MASRYGRQPGEASHFRTCSCFCDDVRKRRAARRRGGYRRQCKERAMAKVDRIRQERHVYKRMHSPVGSLTLVATDEGLAAILWENDRPGRVRLTLEAESGDHPVLVETERQLEEYFAGRR